MTSYYRRPPIDCCSASQTAKAKGQTLIMSRQRAPFLIRHECKNLNGKLGGVRKREIRHIHPVLWSGCPQYSLGSLFCLSTGALQCGRGHRSACLCGSTNHGVHLFDLPARADGCIFPYVWEWRWCEAGTVISRRNREAGVTNILAEHYQQQHKHGLAETQLLIGIFVCVCVCVRVTLWVWVKERKGIVKEEGSAFGDEGNYTRARGRKKILTVLLVSGVLSLGCMADTYQACSCNIRLIWIYCATNMVITNLFLSFCIVEWKRQCKASKVSIFQPEGWVSSPLVEHWQ